MDDEDNDDDDDDLEEMEEVDDDDEIDEEEREIEDKFLNIKEMKEFLEDDEAKEYGFDNNYRKVSKKTANKNAEDDEEEYDDDDDDDDLGVLGLAEEDSSDGEDARYEDFFTSKKKVERSRKPKVNKEVEKEDIDMNDEEEEEEDEENANSEDEGDGDDMASDEEMKTASLSTHEKHLLEQRAKIEEVERENLGAKSWTMQGEVNASKRPKNSALEVDLDWERNAKPPPVITEEVSQSIEEVIIKRIADGQFDDVQKAPSLPSKAPREMKELDESQSKKGLGELYADEFAQKTGLVL